MQLCLNFYFLKSLKLWGSETDLFVYNHDKKNIDNGLFSISAHKAVLSIYFPLCIYICFCPLEAESLICISSLLHFPLPSSCPLSVFPFFPPVVQRDAFDAPPISVHAGHSLALCRSLSSEQEARSIESPPQPGEIRDCFWMDGTLNSHTGEGGGCRKIWTHHSQYLNGERHLHWKGGRSLKRNLSGLESLEDRVSGEVML